MHLVPSRGIQNRKIEPREEFRCIRLHHVPRRVAQHRIEAALAWSLRARTLLGRSGPRAAPGSRRSASRLPRGQNVRPGPRRRDRACQRQQFVIYSLRRQHRRAGPGTRQVPQRLQRQSSRPSPAFNARSAASRQLLPATPAPDGARRAAPHRRAAHILRQQRVQRRRQPAASQAAERTARRANRRAPVDDRERSAAVPRRRTPATATTSPVPPQADCGPRHTGNAPRPAGGRSPARGFARRRCRRLHSRGLADRPAAARSGSGRLGHARTQCRSPRQQPRAFIRRLARCLLLPRRPPTCRTGGTRIQRLAEKAAGFHQEMPAAGRRDRPLSAPGWRPGWDPRPDCGRATAAPSVSRTRKRTNSCGV